MLFQNFFCSTASTSLISLSAAIECFSRIRVRSALARLAHSISRRTLSTATGGCGLTRWGVFMAFSVLVLGFAAHTNTVVGRVGNQEATWGRALRAPLAVRPDQGIEQQPLNQDAPAEFLGRKTSSGDLVPDRALGQPDVPR